MLVGYMRVSKADGSQVLHLQRDALLAAGVKSSRLYQDQMIARSTECLPTVDDQCLARHPAGRIRAQEQRHACNFFWSAEAPPRDRAQYPIV